MKRANRLVGFIAAAILLAAGGIYVFAPDELRHEGRTLDEWLEALVGRQTSPPPEQAREALKAMGDKAVPRLIDMLHARDSKLKEQLELVARLQPWFNVSFGRASTKRAKAILAFKELGPAAATAIPDLRHALETSENPKDVAEALALIGPEAVPALRESLTSEDPNVRSAAIHGLDVSHHTTDAVTEDFLLRLNDDNAIVRFHAARALHHHSNFPDKVVPVLIARLKDESNLVRRYSVHALGAYGPAAREALPQLQEIAADRELDPRIVGAALNSIGLIESETPIRPAP